MFSFRRGSHASCYLWHASDVLIASRVRHSLNCTPLIVAFLVPLHSAPTVPSLRHSIMSGSLMTIETSITVSDGEVEMTGSVNVCCKRSRTSCSTHAVQFVSLSGEDSSSPSPCSRRSVLYDIPYVDHHLTPFLMLTGYIYSVGLSTDADAVDAPPLESSPSAQGKTDVRLVYSDLSRA